MTAPTHSRAGSEERIAELQYEAGMYQSLYENAVKKHIECDADLGKQIAALQARVEELTKALEPFAEYALRMVAFAGSTKPQDWDNIVWAAGFDGTQPEFRHFEAARSALSLEDRKYG